MWALDLHLSQWEWASTAGRLESEYAELLQGHDRGALHYGGRYAKNYGGQPSFYAGAERNVLNKGKTCFLSGDMYELSLYMAGVEFVTSDEEVMVFQEDELLGHAHEDIQAILNETWKGQLRKELFIDETKLPILRREMLPAESGFIVFEKTFPYSDYDEGLARKGDIGKLPYLPIRAIGWDVCNQITTAPGVHDGQGLVLWLYMDSEQMPLAKMRYDQLGWHTPGLLMVDFSGWAFDREFAVGDWVPSPDEKGDGSVVRPHVASIRMFMAAVWGLMNSYVVSHKPTRPQMKLQKRLKMPEDGDVTVIHLRKFLSTVKNKTTIEDYDEEGDPKWSHRWIVRGHWAWRACGHEDHDGRHRVYIDPYIKGPDYLPLVIKEKVLSVDR